ncbi:DUF3820 family protein [Burkholderia sp. Bp8990]|uniref:DUF3820 family protein n=1 Tax=Burkholderia sp. Bp8990 TaxID=2184552 RepID=UPI001C89F0A1|nr:DUF3820 family protein [Burkholderia sp. Bp8990]
MNALILDTETTDATDDRQLIEAAYMRVALQPGYSYVSIASAPFVMRYKPTAPIAFGAMATHHILPEDLEGCPPHDSFTLPGSVEYLIGHSIDFDWQTIGSPVHVKRICTLAMARKVWPDVSHTLSALTYMLSDDRELTRDALRNAHSAKADVIFCLDLLNAIIAKAGPFDSLEALWQFSEECRVPDTFTFGKHKGEKIADVPVDYVMWLMRQPDVDPYLMTALRARFPKRPAPTAVQPVAEAPRA